MVRHSPVKARKEELFMRVVVDDAPVFLNVTSRVGRTSPYRSKVKATCAVRVSDKVVAYSCLQVTKLSAKRLFEAPLQIPRNTLARLETTAVELSEADQLPSDEIVVIHDDETYRFTRQVNDAGVLELEPKFEDLPFELPARGVRMSIFMRSPKVDRIMAVSFSGHLDRKPGEGETRTRAVLKVLTSMLGLGNFGILTDFSSVDLPMPPAGAPVAPRRKPGDLVVFDIPVNLYTEGEVPELIGTGTVTGEVDLDHANAATGQLLYHLTPDAGLEASYGVYKEVIADAVVEIMRGLLPEAEQRDISYSIVLSEVSAGAIETLRDAVSKIGTLDVTPSMYRRRELAATS